MPAGGNRWPADRIMAARRGNKQFSKNILLYNANFFVQYFSRCIDPAE